MARYNRVTRASLMRCLRGETALLLGRTLKGLLAGYRIEPMTEKAMARFEAAERQALERGAAIALNYRDELDVRVRMEEAVRRNLPGYRRVG